MLILSICYNVLGWHALILFLIKLGPKKAEAHIANFSPVMFDIHIFWGWNSNVGSMEWTERVHEHVLGLRLFFSHCVCVD